jgi:hypothetical protein
MENKFACKKFKWWNDASRMQEEREQKNFKVDYFKIETKNCYVKIILF